MELKSEWQVKNCHDAKNTILSKRVELHLMDVIKEMEKEMIIDD